MLFATTLLILIGMSYAGNPPVFSYKSCHCWRYEVYCKNEFSDWKWAKEECENMGGWIATIDTETTHTHIRDMIKDMANTKSCHNNGFWIGFHDDRDPKPDSHQWHPFKFTWVHDQCFKYEKWEKWQPNDNDQDNNPEAVNGQNCVQLWHRAKKNGDYDDEYCYENKGYVCQFEDDCPCAND